MFEGLVTWSDKVRFVPALHLVTLWCYGVDSLRWPGKIGRCAKLLGVLIGCLLIASLVANLLFWTPDWVKAILLMLGGYGIVLAGIYAVRGDVLSQRRLQSQRHR